ncbi:MAG: hypothetical protein IJ397_02850 [Lachnospiraceae bacterium]|nr:hypothetical protein [Lachnospiraceae bacterium]
MEQLKEDKARIFDEFYSNDNLTMLKIFSYFMNDAQRPMIAILIKYMEFNICMQRSMKHHETPFSRCRHDKELDLEEIMEEIGDYLPPEYRGMAEQMKSMKENIEMYSQMMEMMNMMNENSDASASACESSSA